MPETVAVPVDLTRLGIGTGRSRSIAWHKYPCVSAVPVPWCLQSLSNCRHGHLHSAVTHSNDIESAVKMSLEASENRPSMRSIMLHGLPLQAAAGRRLHTWGPCASLVRNFGA